MNKAFLEDLITTAGIDADEHATVFNLQSSIITYRLQLYIAQKLWSIEQLLQHQGGR